ncbi:ESX secretion-associated protein EspG [Actinophytocola xanthii]|uniref:ESX secretion-associated protein EspG n=1 Tax=Actinophytocola xanthii TaxID=1912961 RepID=A0A1Q8CW04_9PSEU|nr:ESX secretion-associated protein EspG [Actinophytocola xanthii]OLF18533.1 ESX secretion-associated protein EspG [Actinophytocola xanthii]
MADRFEFTLDSVEATVVGRAMNADVRRFPLRIRNSTIDPVRFVRLGVLVHDELERRGLSVGGRLHPLVQTALELFNDHQVSVSVSGRTEREEDIAMLAMSDGAQAVGVTQEHGSDALRFSLFPDEDLVRRISTFLPAAPAAPQGTLTVAHRPARAVSAMAARRLAEEEADAEETDAFGNLVIGMVGDGPRRRPSGRSDAEKLGEIMAGQRLGVGFLAASGLRRSGERRSVPPLGWVDTEQGRYLVRTTTEADGTTVATYQPAGAAEVQTAVQEVISSVY